MLAFVNRDCDNINDQPPFGIQHLKPENLNKPEYFHSGDYQNLSQYAQIKHLYYIPSIEKVPYQEKCGNNLTQKPRS